MYRELEILKNRLLAHKVAVKINYKNNSKSRIIDILDLTFEDGSVKLTRGNRNVQYIGLDKVGTLDVRFYFKDISNFRPEEMHYGDSLEKSRVNYIYVRKFKVREELVSPHE